MATINGNYVFVESEDLSRSTKVPQHPVEKGLPITDSVREEPKTLSISGKIVNTDKMTADTILSKLEALRTSGSLIKYSGRNVAGNFIIRSFNTSHPNTVWGGAEFSMELVEVRIAKSAYNEKKGTQTTTTKDSPPKLEVGAIVVFKGGNVYTSSDAKKAAANRGRQTCKITKISTKSWSVHQYHLISTEKKYPYNVYGWVDVENIEGTGSGQGAVKTNTAAVTNAGTQQVKSTTVDKNKPHMAAAGETRKDIIFDGLTEVDRCTRTIGTTQYVLYQNYYYLRSVLKKKTIDGGRTTAYVIPAGSKAYKYINKDGVVKETR